jgi:GRASP55/65 PDZ-like domain
LKAQDQRIVTLRPRDGWGGAGLLGVTIRLDNYGGAEERLVRVLDVEPHSPAADCGLMADGSDYLLGTTAVALESTDVLASVLHQHVDQIVELYVYNSETDLVRVVGLMPTYKWSNGRIGGGLLGAEVGTGYLHRLPEKCRHTIGQSVERTVQVMSASADNSKGGVVENGGSGVVNATSLDDTNVQMEPHLEMEVDHGEVLDRDVMRSGATPRTRQPHQLGVASSPPVSPTKNGNGQQQQQPEPERQESLRSISISSEAGGTEYQQVEEAVASEVAAAATAVQKKDNSNDRAMAEKADTAATELEKEGLMDAQRGPAHVEHDDSDVEEQEESSKDEEEEDEEGSVESTHSTPPESPEPQQSTEEPDDHDHDFPQAAPVVVGEAAAASEDSNPTTPPPSPSRPLSKPKVETVDTSKGDEKDGEEEEDAAEDGEYHSDEYESDDEYTDDEEDDESDGDEDSPPKKKKGFLW